MVYCFYWSCCGLSESHHWKMKLINPVWTTLIALVNISPLNSIDSSWCPHIFEATTLLKTCLASDVSNWLKYVDCTCRYIPGDKMVNTVHTQSVNLFGVHAFQSNHVDEGFRCLWWVIITNMQTAFVGTFQMTRWWTWYTHNQFSRELMSAKNIWIKARLYLLGYFDFLNKTLLLKR